MTGSICGWTGHRSSTLDQSSTSTTNANLQTFCGCTVKSGLRAESLDALVRRRTHSPLQTTGELAAVVREAVGEKFLVKSLARVFQALRIEVNNELMNLETALAQAIVLLESGGRLVVISYHSLEDRIVKDSLKREAASVQRSGNKLVPDTPLQPKVKILTKKLIAATDEECRRNPRSRSAKMRVAEAL